MFNLYQSKHLLNKILVISSRKHVSKILNQQIYRKYHSGNKKPVDLTQDRYKVIRGNYSILKDNDVTYFEKLIGKTNILTNENDINTYNIDFLKSCKGRSKIVLKPKNVQEISAILKYCNEKKLAVCPQGGNTGLVGGSVPVFDEIIISMQRLNKIKSIDEITGIMISESGCILENLEIEARNNGLCLPLDLGAKGSCHIGGNISTNAGGLRVLRYGNLHGSVLGLEAVLASGEILNLMSNFKKDNTGYHLKHMFIGSEGTLGIITNCAILCPPLSKSIHVAFLGLQSYDSVLRTFLNAKRHLGEIISACEMIDSVAFKASISNFNLNPPINDSYPFYMLIETSGTELTHDEEKFHQFLNNGMDCGDIVDGTITGEQNKINEIWKIRELVPISLMSDGYCYKYDISLPLHDFYNIVLIMQKRMSNFDVKVSGYGHLGDSNLHLNVSCKEFTQDIYKTIEPFVYEYTAKLNGSISAEHGLGFLKKNYLGFTKTNEAINLMKDIKKMLDPNNILNPYKVLPE